MLPKSVNPHSLSLGLESTTRAEHAERTEIVASVSHDDETDSLTRTLHDLLRDTWTEALAQGPSYARTKKRRKTEESNEPEDHKLVFRPASSMKHPQRISLEPKASPPPKTKEPVCEDSIAQAEERMKRARSVAVEFDRQWNVSVPCSSRKPTIVEAKVPLANRPLPHPLPTMLVTAESRATNDGPTHLRRTRKAQGSQLGEATAASPHEPRATCTILPVQSVLNRSGTFRRRRRRKQAKEMPLPTYWRPPPTLRGKCMGYALGHCSR